MADKIISKPTSKQFRDNYDEINWSSKQPDPPKKKTPKDLRSLQDADDGEESYIYRNQ